mmetsp:Transcript_2925/g.8476  ORF Transcript_2925/g.8476 Transcript_2925/m.8476 type:complete len:321 (-) Transcript_2925:2004-2966(-)
MDSTSAWPPRAARCAGRRPWRSSRAFTSAPAASNSLAIGPSPTCAHTCSGVMPCAAAALGSSPPRRSTRTASTVRFPDAMHTCRAERPWSEGLGTGAPAASAFCAWRRNCWCLSRMSMQRASPPSAAASSTVQPVRSMAGDSSPPRSARTRPSGSPRHAAAWASDMAAKGGATRPPCLVLGAERCLSLGRACMRSCRAASPLRTEGEDWRLVASVMRSSAERPLARTGGGRAGERPASVPGAAPSLSTPLASGSMAESSRAPPASAPALAWRTGRGEGVMPSSPLTPASRMSGCSPASTPSAGSCCTCMPEIGSKARPSK